jgi:hypothetical protein
MNRICFLVTFIFFSLVAFGQSEPSASKISYFFSVHTGGLLGGRDQGSSFTSSIIQGVRVKKFALGVGLGHDAVASWRTLPVWASVRFDFAKVRLHNFYFQLDGGYAKAWLPSIDEGQFTYREKGGIFFHPQIGYRINADKLKVYLSAGYKIQRIEYEQISTWNWGGGTDKYFVTRDIERVSVQIGFGLY